MRCVTCAPADGGDVPGLVWAAAGSCSGVREVTFTYTPPAHVYLQPAPNNQVSFCLTLRLLSQASSGVVLVVVVLVLVLVLVLVV